MFWKVKARGDTGVRAKGKPPNSPDSLSTGEQQMLALARVYFASSLLLVDEPFTGLSPLATRQTLEQLTQIRDLGISLLLAEQNIGLALEVSNRCYYFSSGRIVGSYRPDDLRGQDLRELQKNTGV